MARMAGEQAMARMATEKIAPTPANYTIWHTYYSSALPDLTRAVDRVASESGFTAERMEELYRTFYGREERAIRDAGDRIQEALGRLSDLLKATDADTGRYGRSLERFSADLAVTALDELRSLVDAIGSETSLMLQRNQRLQIELEASSLQMAEMRQNLDRVRREAVTDGLTSLFNRRHFDLILPLAAGEAVEGDQPLSLLMIDIDHFKQFNDTHGHAMGDQVLKLVARTLSDCIKGRDTAARFGGEEFAILLPETKLTHAVTVAEQIRNAVASKKLVNRAKNQTLGTITLSIGVAQFRPGEKPADVVQRADEGLYSAKRNGRNRVVAM
jgi:diguanylate cyclase